MRVEGDHEPIMNTPAQALDCFLRTHMDTLVIGPFLMRKEDKLHSNEKRRALAQF